MGTVRCFKLGDNSLKCGAIDFQQTLGHFVALVALLLTLHYTTKTAGCAIIFGAGKSNWGKLG